MSMNSRTNLVEKSMSKRKQCTIVFLAKDLGKCHHMLYASVPAPRLKRKRGLNSARRILVRYRR